tara:strand:+ start:350 stop:769 length:420 start_codon:yes stop_codon:yes gene_type:complete
MPTTEFYDDPLKAQQPPIWRTSLNKLQWTMNVHWQPVKSPKKSETISTVNTVAGDWQLTLAVKSSDTSETRALADALATDEAVVWNKERSSFSFTLNEAKSKDLRAMWNTRIRGLIAVDSLLEILSESKQGEDSSTPSE